MEESPLQALLDFYAKLDERVNQIKALNGLECPARCGWCCETADPEITVYEALPLARVILSMPALISDYDNFEGERLRRCFFYDAARPYHCTIYPMRPLICRAFGYAGNRDKFGAVRFATCKKMLNSEKCFSIELDSVLVFQELQYELLAMAAPELAKLRPFNDALAEAVQRETLRKRFEVEEELPGASDEGNPDLPDAPNTPCPAAA